MSKYVECECGAFLRLGSINEQGGWTKWYHLDTRVSDEKVLNGPDKVEFYKDLQESLLKLPNP